MKKIDWETVEMKKYEVTYNGTFGKSVEMMLAPNKTICRKMFTGMMNPNCKIIKIEEVK